MKLELIENNKLIAEFMGYINTTPSDRDFNIYENKEGVMQEPMSMKYHSLWDWLMPVIKKCKECQIFGSQYLINNIDKRLLDIDLLSVYYNVITFIEFYNKNKKS